MYKISRVAYSRTSRNGRVLPQTYRREKKLKVADHLLKNSEFKHIGRQPVLTCRRKRTEKWNPRRESSKEVENNRLSCILLCNDSPVMMRWAVAAENLLIKANGMLNKQ